MTWEVAEKNLEAWGVLCHVFLGDTAMHPATYEVCSLLEETAYVGTRLQPETQRPPTLTVSLLRLLQTDFN